METIIHNYWLAAFAIFIYMAIWFFLALLKKRNDLADIAWGLGFILVILVTFPKFNLQFSNSLLVGILVTIWGVRLSSHIFLRNIHKPEDKRYAAWRNQWGKWVNLRSFFQIFMLQGLLLLIISSPIVVINSHDSTLSYFSLLGVIIWLLGFIFESVGDYQLTSFIKNPNNIGKVLNTGLWRYTRHPNYFGEVTQWWGIWLIALNVFPFGIFAILGPLTISFLILKVSGVPMLEKSLQANQLFQNYIQTTSKFFPWFPKNNL